MKELQFPRRAFTINALALTSALFLNAQTSVTARMTVTRDVMGEGKRTPQVNLEDVMVMQGKESLKVTGWVPACEDQAGLDLFILIDDISDSSLGLQLEDLRAFIRAQPETTSVGVGYMSNAVVQIAQNFTTDHAVAAKALRLPPGNAAAYRSPYRSVIDLMIVGLRMATAAR